MEFRPCIDIHNGKVKQIVGGSLKDEKDFAKENFVSEMQAADYAALYREKGLRGGHIILLNAADSPYYEADLMQAKGALLAWQGALQVGGGIHAENAASFLDFGASHVIVTSYVFVGGEIRFDRLQQLVKAVGKEHVVLDLSCRKKGDSYYIVTDRWQKFTNQCLDEALMEKLHSYCDEFLVHAALAVMRTSKKFKKQEKTESIIRLEVPSICLVVRSNSTQLLQNLIKQIIKVFVKTNQKPLIPAFGRRFFCI